MIRPNRSSVISSAISGGSPPGDAGPPLRPGEQIPHEGRAAGRAVPRRLAERGVPEHVIPVGVRREARCDVVTGRRQVVCEAGHLVVGG